MNSVYCPYTHMEQHTTTEKINSNEKSEDVEKNSVEKNIESLIKWQFTEEKKVYTKDKELLIIIIGIGAIALTVITETYTFGALLTLATITLINIVRKKPKNLLFSITPIGMFMNNDFIETRCIKGFNIIDDPGNRARLILKVERIVNINEIIPIYDVDIQDIERILTELEIPKEETLEQTVMDRLTAMII